MALTLTVPRLTRPLTARVMRPGDEPVDVTPQFRAEVLHPVHSTRWVGIFSVDGVYVVWDNVGRPFKTTDFALAGLVCRAWHELHEEVA